MRSKEVDDAIDVLENVFIFKDTYDRFTKLDLNSIHIALNYISELEEENKKISDELIEEKQLNVKYLKIREEKENIIKKISLEAQKYFDMLMEVEYGRDTFPKQKIKDKIKEIEENPNNPYQKVMASQIDASLISCLKEILGE